MNTIRALKRRSRMLLHDKLSEPVWFFREVGSAPQATTVRLHIQFDRFGSLLREQYAEREDIDPKIVFLTPIRPVRNSYVVTADMGIWFVEAAQPPDDITIIASAKEANPRDIEGLGLDPELPWGGLSPVTAEDLASG